VDEEIFASLINKRFTDLYSEIFGAQTVVQYAMKQYPHYFKILLNNEMVDYSYEDTLKQPLLFSNLDSSEQFKLLLEKEGVNLNCVNQAGIPLIFAALYYPASFELLLAKEGVNVNCVDRGDTPLIFAALHFPEQFKLLLAKENIDLNCVDGTGKPLIFEALHYPELFKLLLVKEGVNLNCTNERGKPLIFEALYYPELFKLLIEKEGVDINCNFYSNPLIFEAVKYPLLFKLLLEHDKIDLSKKGYSDKPITFEVLNNLDSLKLILDKIDPKEYQMKELLLESFLRGFFDSAIYLLKKGAKLESDDLNQGDFVTFCQGFMQHLAAKIATEQAEADPASLRADLLLYEKVKKLVLNNSSTSDIGEAIHKIDVFKALHFNQICGISKKFGITELPEEIAAFIFSNVNISDLKLPETDMVNQSLSFLDYLGESSKAE
jgi:hypothetical protein